MSSPTYRLGAILVVVVVLAPMISTGATVEAQTTGRPNILLIVTDDQRRGTLGMMPEVRRWFRREGTEFSNAYANTPLCCPSRTSILTGQYPHNHGIWGNDMDPASLANAQAHMVQSALDAAGYRTGLFGKFLNGWPNDVNPASFDRWTTTPRISFSGDEWNENGTIVTVEQNSTSYIGDQTMSFIDEAEVEDDTPWFTLVGFMAPHLPATVEPPYEDVVVRPATLSPAMRETDRSDKPAHVRRLQRATIPQIEARRTAQLRSLVPLDDQIGRIMERLTELDELEDTLAIFVSDNGYLWGEHGIFSKSVPYDPAIRVPLLVRWPGHVPAGAIDGRLVGLVDLGRTMAAAAGVSLPHEPDGMNLLNAEASRRRLLLEFRRILPRHVPSWNALLTDEFVFVEYRRHAGGLIAREYYDREEDPHQLRNLFGDGRRDKGLDVGPLRRRLARLTTCAGTSCPQ